MAYLVNITARAERDLAQLYEDIEAGHSRAALKWYLGLKRAILSLEERPNRTPVMRTRGKLRQLLYGRKPHVYRVIYRSWRKRDRLRCSTSDTAQDESPALKIFSDPRGPAG